MLEWDPFISTSGGRRTYWRTMLFSLAMLAGAVACNAVMDTLQFHYKESIFASEGFDPQWWNPELSGLNKWKEGLPANGERFPLSSSVLAGFTDAWHLFKTFMIAFIGLAIVAPFSRLLDLPWYGWVAGGGAAIMLFWLSFEMLIRVL